MLCTYQPFLLVLTRNDFEDGKSRKLVLLDKYQLVYQIVFEHEHIQKQYHNKLALNYSKNVNHFIVNKDHINFTQQDQLRVQDVQNLNHSLIHKHHDFLFQVNFSLEKEK
jgi:hypothetical protein